MKRMVLASLVALVVAAHAASADPTTLDGAWTAQVPTPNGQAKIAIVFTFRMEGSKLTGTAAVAGAEVYPLVDTAISGNDISFAVEGEPERFTGTLNGDQIAMKVTFKSSENGIRTWSFVAKRATAQSSATGQSPIDGEWSGEVPRGGSRYIAAQFVFRVEGSTLAGHVNALDDQFPVTDGKVEGPRIAFRIGDTKGDYSGELVDGTIRMKVKYDGGENGRQTLDFVLKRARR